MIVVGGSGLVESVFTIFTSSTSVPYWRKLNISSLGDTDLLRRVLMESRKREDLETALDAYRRLGGLTSTPLSREKYLDSYLETLVEYSRRGIEIGRREMSKSERQVYLFVIQDRFSFLKHKFPREGRLSGIGGLRVVGGCLLFFLKPGLILSILSTVRTSVNSAERG